VVDAFAKAHPGVTVTLDLSDHPGAQLVESSDVVAHIGPPGAQNQIVTTLAPNRRILCASPGYLAGASPIQSPSDLLRHRCLVVRENDEDVTLWRFVHASREPETVRIRPAMCSNDGAVVREWAVAGQGVAIRSEWNVAADLAALGGAPRIDRAMLSAKADEIDRMVKRLRAMSEGLRHAAACPARSHAQCPSFQKLLEAAASGALEKRRPAGRPARGKA
jgi:DNA-binding transcriptional LysR family regulator